MKQNIFSLLALVLANIICYSFLSPIAFAEKDSAQEDAEEGYDFGSDDSAAPAPSENTTTESTDESSSEKKTESAGESDESKTEKSDNDTESAEEENNEEEDEEEDTPKKKKKKPRKKEQDIIIESSHIMRAYGLGFGSAHFSLDQYDSGYMYLFTDVLSLVGVSFGIFGGGYVKFLVPVGLVTFLGSHYFQGADIHEQYYRQRETIEEENPQGIKPAWSMTHYQTLPSEKTLSAGLRFSF